MPCRRSVLAAGGTVTVAALAGCSTLGSPDGSPAQITHSRDLRPDDGEIIAQTSAERIGCPAGDIELQAIGFELPNNALQTFTKIDVFPGHQECKSNWSHDGATATHDWSNLGLESESYVTDTTSNVVYADTGGDVGLENTSNSEKGRCGTPMKISQVNLSTLTSITVRAE